MLLEVELSDLMVDIVPKIYQNYVIMRSKGKPLLYVKTKKMLYGLLRSALLLYRNLVKDLELYGFQIIPYDSCMAKNMIKIIR